MDLSQTRTLMEISTKTGQYPANTVPFDCGDEEESRAHLFYMDRSVWDEMGGPVVITVTVVPGDALNEGV